MIEVFVIEDHTIVREGLVRIINATSDLRVTGEAELGREGCRQVRNGAWDVLVLDVTLPDVSGLEVLADVQRHRPDLPVVILTMHDEPHFALEAFKAGAHGYVTKDSAAEELINAIRSVVSGRRYLPLKLAGDVTLALAAGVSGPLHSALSPREYEVFGLLAAGHGVSQIARRLRLSVKTVSTHRTHILEKMRLQNNAQLMRYAIDHRLIN